MIDNIFSPDYQYYKGQYCVYNGVLYRAKTDIPVGTPFSTDNWEYRQIGLDLYILSSSKENKLKRYMRTGKTNVTASTGTLYASTFSIVYNNEMVLSFVCRILVQNVPAGVTNNPVITISGLPSDIPAFDGIGCLNQKGTDSTEVGDGCKFTHSANSTIMTVDSFNFMGTARAGWVCYTVPGVY